MSMARKAAFEIQGAIRGTNDYSFVEGALTTWLYPIDLAFTLAQRARYYPTFDTNGIPTKDHGDGKQHYNPTRIAAFGLAHHDQHLRFGKSADLEAFMKVADWFASSREAIWEYNFDWGGLRAPWISAMAQGVGISVLVRAYQITGNSSYLHQAALATGPLTKSIHNGGVRSTLPNGRPFLEEYPLSLPNHVLNGFLYTLIGLAALDRVDKSLHDGVDFPALIRSIEDSIGAWDTGHWSTYDIDVRRTGISSTASLTYHRVHVAQLSYLGRYLNSPRLVSVADEWHAHQNSRIKRVKALAKRINYLRATRRI